MKQTIRPGDVQNYRRIVLPEDVAAFHGTIIHSVCATFALARDVEWTSRLFVLQIFDADEEGIGTMLSIHHKRPAFVGEEVSYTARVETWEDNELICSFTATAGGRLVATGTTGQKVLKREALQSMFSRHQE
jgi:predicted thioesterase